MAQQKVARNVFSLIFSKVLASILVFLGYAALFRYLGTFRTGEYQFALSYVMLFSVVVDFGIQQLVIKKISEDKTQAKKYLGHFFTVELFLAALIYGLLAGIAIWRGYDPIVQKAILLAGFGMFINALTIPYTAVISAYEDMHLLAVVNFFDSVINVGVMFAAILTHHSVVFLASVQALMGLMHLIVYNVVIRKYIPHLGLWQQLKEADFGLAKQMFKAALPFGMLVGFSIIYNKIDVVILSALTNYSETGLYTAAYKFFDVLAFLPAVVSSSLYPFFSNQIQERNISAVKSALQNYTRYMIGLAMPIAFGGAVLAPKLIVALAGKDFAPGFTAVQILVFASATLFIYSAVNSLMINQLTKYAVIITFVNIFINSVGNFLLIPHFGFRAAAFMTFVSELTQAVAYFYFVRKKIVSFPLLSSFVKPVLSAFVMAIVIYPLRAHSLLITLPLGIAIYGLMILLTGFLKRADLERIRFLLTRKAYEEVKS